MAEYKQGDMDITENKATYGRFMAFWKYFFIMCVAILILLAIVGT